jgi:hypothetical protein
MGNLTNALILVMCINVVLFLGQISILKINPSGTGEDIYRCQGTLLSRFDNSSCQSSNYSLNTNLATSSLPSAPPTAPEIPDPAGGRDAGAERSASGESHAAGGGYHQRPGI